MDRSNTPFINPRALDMPGPDFLRAIADKEAALGNEVNAAEYRRRASQWQADIDATASAPAPVEWPAHRPPVRRACELPKHHITPTDRR
ncbi:MAG TPA: hypothetical protein VIT90_15220 [Lysobacter sp.]